MQQDCPVRGHKDRKCLLEDQSSGEENSVLLQQWQRTIIWYSCSRGLAKLINVNFVYNFELCEDIVKLFGRGFKLVSRIIFSHINFGWLITLVWWSIFFLLIYFICMIACLLLFLNFFQPWWLTGTSLQAFKEITQRWIWLEIPKFLAKGFEWPKCYDLLVEEIFNSWLKDPLVTGILSIAMNWSIIKFMQICIWKISSWWNIDKNRWHQWTTQITGCKF